VKPVTDSTATQPTRARSNLSAWRNAVFILFALGGVGVSTWGPRLPSIRQDLGVGDGGIGVALAGVPI